MKSDAVWAHTILWSRGWQSITGDTHPSCTFRHAVTRTIIDEDDETTKKLIHKREHGYIRVNSDWPCPWSYEFLSHTHANSGKEVYRVKFVLLPCWGSSLPPRACFPLLSVPLWTRRRFCYNTSLPSFFFCRFLPEFLLVFNWLPHTRFYYFPAPSNLSLN